jgi:D-lactate dehydrogenase (cytochrome)
MEEMEKGMAIYKEFAERAVAYGGTISAEHGIGKLKVKYLKTMYSDGQLEQMRALKQAFDPGMLLNPGNIFTH